MRLKSHFWVGLLLFFCATQANAQNCFIPNLPDQFKAKLSWQSTKDGPACVTTPLVANLNPQADSMPEIVVMEGNWTLHNKIQFYRGDGTNAANPMVLTVPGGFDNYPAPSPTIGDIDGDGIPELLVACADNKIRIFNHYTENPVAPMTLWLTSSDPMDFRDQRPLLADFDADGLPEIYAGSDIFKFNLNNPAAPTLIKVINGPANRGQSAFSNFSEGASNPTAVDLLTVADCNGDPDCGGLELAAGSMIYSVDMDPNDGDGYEIKVQRALNTMVAPADNYRDGYTAVADVDLDGILDVVVTSVRRNNETGMYVWNKNGLLGFFPYPSVSFSSGSLACIANVYDDRQNGYAVDYPEILICSSMNFTCFNLHAAQSTPAKPYWWNLVTSDNSGWTGSTVYDFNGDGISEIVYRDESNLRILYGGALPFPTGVDAERNWFKTPSFSITADEYPVVADVDNDGETDIVVTGRLTLGNTFNERYRGRLSVFRSNANPWVPCRNVWNQYNYFIVNVNDDLSIPAVQQMHHLELPVPGSGIRPFNAYLAQRPRLNENFEPFIPLPDASAEVGQYQCLSDSVTVEVEICNTGNKPLLTGTPIAFYATDPTTTAAVLFGNLQWTNAAIEKDSCRIFQFKVPNQPGTYYGVVNDDASTPTPFQLDVDFPVTTQLECNFLNNIFQFDIPVQPPPFSLGPDIGLCRDTVLLLQAGAGYLHYQWQDGSTATTFQASQPGTYWVEATDFCAQKHLDSLLVETFAPPMIQLDAIDGNCFGQTASLNALAQSPYPPLQYAWSTGAAQPQISGIPDGMYTVTVTNARGCTAVDSSWIEAGGNLAVSGFIQAPVLCYGENGSLALNFNAGNPPFAFQWSDGSTNPDLANVPAGNYSVTVSDADACADTIQLQLSQPTALISNGLSASPSCPGLSNGAAGFLGAAQGTPPYTFIWSTGANTPDLSDLSAGIYQLTLSDANGCSVLEQVLVDEFLAPETAVLQQEPSCFGMANGSLALDILNGSPAYTYSWSTNETSAQIQGLQAGNYALTLTYANGACNQIFDFQLNTPLPIQLSAGSAPAICNGGLGGSIDLQIQNGIPPLGFLWSNNAVSEDLPNVAAGNYQVTVTDAKGCSQTLQQTVAEWPAITLKELTQPPLCAGALNGNIQLLPANGTAPYQYLWSNGATTIALNGIGAGIYTVTVSDAAACTQTLEFTLSEPDPLLSLGISTEGACPAQANGSAMFLGAAQGTPPYSVLWSTGAVNAGITGLTAGVYQLTLTDAQGCSLSENVEVPEFSPPGVQAVQKDVRCSGAGDGSIALQLSGGSPDFSYAWSNGSGNSGIQNLTPGTYTVTVSYATGNCTQSFEYQINEPPALDILNPVVTPVNCFGEQNGAIQLNTTGGVAPYLFQWTGNLATEDLSNLPAGEYVLQVTDKNGCTLQAQYSIPQPEALAISAVVGADTCLSADGLIRLETNGGVQPYVFSWSNGIQNPDQTALSAGTYLLTLTDAHFCTETYSFEVPAFGEAPVLNTYSELLTCTQTSVPVGVSANQNNLQYHWVSPSGNLSNLPEHLVQLSGNYQVTVTNPFGCQSTAQIQVLEDKEAPLAEAGPPMLDISCNETSALLDAGNSTQGNGFLNQWSGFPDGLPGFEYTGLQLPIFSAGWYIHEVLNLNNGCSDQDSIRVNWDAPIAAVLAVDSIRCFGDNNGKIELQEISGGTPPYQYAIDNQPFGTQTLFAGLVPGNYLLHIRDGLGCQWAQTVQLTEPGPLSVTLTANDTVISLGETLQLQAIPTPASADLSAIEWAPEALTYGPMSLRQRVKPETHTEFLVRITDQNGCVAEDRLKISVYNLHIYVPNIILPGSESNSWFTLFAGDGVLEIRSLRVFDRWGEQVFERSGFLPNEPTLGWDGSYRAQDLNPGVFVWYAEVLLHDAQVLMLKGDVTVAR